FQFPPAFEFTEERLGRILKNINQSFINVVEFRHPGWWNEEVYTQLGNEQIIFCGINHPLLPSALIMNGSKIYYRFHVVPKMFYSEYDKLIMKTFAVSLIKEPFVDTVYCYFNNTAACAAI